MSEKAEKENKKSPLETFKQSLAGSTQLTAQLSEGIKSTNAKVRSLAIKLAFKSQDSSFIKKNVTPLIASDKSKKVLRTIAKRLTRKPLIKKLADLAVKAVQKEKKQEEAAAAEAPKA